MNDTFDITFHCNHGEAKRTAVRTAAKDGRCLGADRLLHPVDTHVEYVLGADDGGESRTGTKCHLHGHSCDESGILEIKGCARIESNYAFTNWT